MGLIARAPLGLGLSAFALVLAAAGPAAGEMGDEPAFVRAWSAPGLALEERVERTRTAALELGLHNVEPAAQGLLAGVLPEGTPPTPPLETAEAAVRLAPDLPAAHMALALARFSDLDPFGGFSAAVGALHAFRSNLEAALWLHAAVWWAAGSALALGAVLYLVVAGLAVAREASHDLGDVLSRHTPDFSRAGLLAAALLLPAALGEGLLGAALGLAVLVAAYGGRGSRAAVAAAAAVLAAALHPMLEQSGRALASFAADPIALSAYTAERGFASPLHLARLSRASTVDPLAARALALGVKRTGHIADADARYSALLGEEPDDPVLLNNAANVRLALGDTQGAIVLYQRSLEVRPSATVWFNLSQAWGVALNVVELDSALARAQQLDPHLVHDLSAIQDRAIHFVADLTVPSEALRRRLLATGEGEAVAAGLRRSMAPGLVGATPVSTGAGLVLAIAAGALLGGRFRPSRGCQRCGALVCPRCHRAASGGLCEGCAHLSQRDGKGPRTRPPADTRRRVLKDRLALAAALLVPGAGGVLCGRHGLALASCILAVSTYIGVASRKGPAPDVLAAGAAGPVLFLAAAGICGLAYAVLLVPGILARRDA